MNKYYIVKIAKEKDLYHEFRCNGSQKEFSYEIAHGGTLIIHDNGIDTVFAPGTWENLITDEDTEFEES